MGKTHRHSPRITARVELKDGAMRGAMHLYDAIGGWDGIRAKHVVEKLEALKAEGAQHLDVHVNSPGGDVFEGMAIHTAIAGWSGEKVVHIDGLAASIASIIAMAGDEIRISPTAMVMIHEPRGFAMGAADDLRKMADRLGAIRDVMCGVYTARTGLAKAEVEKLVAAETWMSADEAVKKGFADKVIAPDEEPEEDDPDESDEEEEPEEDSFARAVALFRNPPPNFEKLLSIPLPVALAAVVPAVPPPHAKESTVTFEELKTKLNEATATATAMQARAETSEKSAAEFLAATGAKTIGEAVAMVAGLRETAAKAAELGAEIARRDAEVAKAAVEKRANDIVAMFDAASKDGRLTPAKRKELEASGKPFTKDPEQLKAFLDCLQPVVVPVTAVSAPAENAATELSADEKSCAEQLKIDPKKVIEFKASQKK